MLEKLISIITAFVISVASFFQGPQKIPIAPPTQNQLALPDTPRLDLPQEVEPQNATTKPTQTDIPKPKTPEAQPPTQEPPAPPDAPRLDLPSEVEPQNETKKSIKPRPIDLRSVVGLTCDFENKNTGEKTKYRGSGVIIREGTHSKGTYILTNRHVVDIQWAKQLTEDETIDPGLKLTGCDVRILAAERNILPEEKYPYPYYDLRNISGFRHDFTARLAYLPAVARSDSGDAKEGLPATEGLSEDEEVSLDYAILEVTGKNESKYFEDENPPLPSVPILIPSPEEWLELIKESRVVMPGYAFQQAGSGSFEEFRLLTKDGIVKEIYAGDKAMQDVLISIIMEVPPDAYGGRSGSPIFYKGYLIGLVATKALPMPNSGNFQSPQPAITGIIENMNSQAATKEIFEKIFYFE